MQTSNELKIDCTDLPKQVDMAFDLSDSPNIPPTVAAMAATIPGRVRLTGSRLTQFHKSGRIEAMATELAKADIGVSLLHDAEGAVDDLGAGSRRGGVEFSTYDEHRIFMSLVVFSLSRSEIFNGH